MEVVQNQQFIPTVRARARPMARARARAKARASRCGKFFK